MSAAPSDGAKADHRNPSVLIGLEERLADRRRLEIDEAGPLDAPLGSHTHRITRKL
jgi:hypothetical protein